MGGHNGFVGRRENSHTLPYMLTEAVAKVELLHCQNTFGFCLRNRYGHLFIYIFKRQREFHGDKRDGKVNLSSFV